MPILVSGGIKARVLLLHDAGTHPKTNMSNEKKGLVVNLFQGIMILLPSYVGIII